MIFRSRKLEIRKSKINGMGVFALQDFSKDDLVLTIKGIQRKAEYSLKEAHENSNDIAIGHELWIQPYEHNEAWYLNHYCNANTGIRGRVQLVAKTAIKAGDEITIDYSTIEANPFWEMACTCGYEKCRKQLLSFPNMDSIFKQTNFNYLPVFLKKNLLSQEE